MPDGIQMPGQGGRPGQNRPGPGQNPGGPPPGASQPDVDPSDLPDITCDCGSKTFTEALRLKKMSALVSPSGEEGIAPVQTFVCTQCGKEHDEFKIENRDE